MKKNKYKKAGQPKKEPTTTWSFRVPVSVKKCLQDNNLLNNEIFNVYTKELIANDN